MLAFTFKTKRKYFKKYNQLSLEYWRLKKGRETSASLVDILKRDLKRLSGTSLALGFAVISSLGLISPPNAQFTLSPEADV